MLRCLHSQSAGSSATQAAAAAVAGSSDMAPSELRSRWEQRGLGGSCYGCGRTIRFPTLGAGLARENLLLSTLQLAQWIVQLPEGSPLLVQKCDLGNTF